MTAVPRELILYTTLGCSLCEKAKVEIWPLLEQFQLRLREVDIADDPLLMERLSTRIPAVGLGDPNQVCCWPFDSAQLREWLRHQ
ncbi:glutaredoxin family protein [Microbulbifer thermotolerans]|uniref:Glutaredoxin family protein n=1 Tax=Microbulbifer thermotolerans TaxID=252514 RepID=A0AB35HUT5_MICTH|nr:glutaredoxin family protein [Microbulbifer thermotolerans]MCX2800417.1 glutaredoxin family protein [Microbulbifer thermotolerans]MCX2833525.1 glutaredoxin family protein [Microbulbifer thermotolerans]